MKPSRIRVTSPPLSLVGFEQAEWVRPDRFIDRTVRLAVATAIAAPLLVMADLVLLRPRPAGLAEVLWFCLTPMVGLMVVAAASRATRRCLRCSGVLQRLRHSERLADGREWHGTLFACAGCKVFAIGVRHLD